MKIKAAVLHQLHAPLKIEEIEIPPLKKGQLLVRILCSGICRAQYNEIVGLKGPDRYLPHLLGHEASGIVEEIGPGVTKVKRGDYVALSWIQGSGLEGGPKQYKNGSQMINAGAVTTFSEYSVVSENRVTKISKKIPPDIASIIGCAVVTGMGIINNTLKAPRGSSVVIFGVGGVGLSAVLGARARGCSPIAAVDVSSQKLAMARRFGATDALDANQKGLLKRLRPIAPEGFYFSIDASGVKAAMETAFEAINVRGTCVIAGNLGKEEKISLHPFELIKGKRIIGTWGGETVPERDIPGYVRDFCSGRLPLERLITHRFKLEEINTAFEVLQSGEAGRIVIEMAHT